LTQRRCGRRPPLILASASPRRRELLGQLGLQFEVVNSVAEPACPAGADPCRWAMHSAAVKALWVLERRPEAVVLGADTLVWLDGNPLGKPADDREAAEMLRRLSGRTHFVHTGVALVGPAGAERAPSAACVDTAVRFRELPEDLIDRYVATGEPLDKAGAYGIQGRGAALVEGICGCYYSVVGLPLATVARMLEERGFRAV
jgi:septum formation protein